VRTVFFTAGTAFSHYRFVVANEKFTHVLVRARIKSHVPGHRVGKSNGRLKKCHATASQFYADCAGTPNRYCITLYDVIHYNDVISALGSYVFRSINFEKFF